MEVSLELAISSCRSEFPSGYHYFLSLKSFLQYFLLCRFIGNKFSQLLFISKCLYFTLIYKGYFCSIWNSELIVTSFVIFYLLASTDSDENSAIICVIVLLSVTRCFSLDHFAIFRNLATMCIGVTFFAWGFAKLLRAVG